METTIHNGARRILRPKAVVERTGLSRTTLWRHVRGGSFPKPLALGERAIGWFEADVSAWMDGLSRGAA